MWVLVVRASGWSVLPALLVGFMIGNARAELLFPAEDAPNPDNRASFSRVVRVSPDAIVDLDDGAPLFDADASTTVSLRADGSERLELRFRGSPRWLNHVEVVSDDLDLEVQLLDLTGKWVTYGERSGGGREVVVDGRDMRAQGLRLLPSVSARSASTVAISEVFADFRQVDPDRSGSSSARAGGGIYHYDWVNDYSATSAGNLSKCDDDARGLRDELPGSWTYGGHGNSGAKENHFKRTDIGTGDNQDHIDWADLSYYSGHGSSSRSDSYWGLNLSAFSLGTFVDDRFVVPSDGRAAWGDGNMEWLCASACNILTTLSDNYWAKNMDRLHLMCGAQSTIVDAAYGERFGRKLVDNGLFDSAWTIKSSWWDCMDHHNSSGRVVVIGETSAAGGDYIWGEGSVISDPTHDSTFYRWTKRLTAATAPEEDVLQAHIVHDPEHYRRSENLRVFSPRSENGFTVRIDPALLVQARVAEMTVYDVVPSGIDDDYVRQVAASICAAEGFLCGLEDVGAGDLGERIATIGPHELRVRIASGRYAYANTEEWLGWRTNPASLPNESQALDRATAIASAWQGGQLPGAQVKGIDYVFQSAFELFADGTEQEDPDSSHAVAINVNFQRELGGFLVGGAGGVARISLGDMGRVLRVSQNGWRQVTPGPTVPTMPFTEAIDALTVEGWDACIQGVKSDADDIEITAWELGYFEAPGSVPVTQIRPCFILYTMIGSGDPGSVVPAEFYVWAERVQPQGTILSPPDGTEIEPGMEVCFAAAAVHGVPPYSFRWLDTEGAVIGVGAEACATLMPPPPDETGHVDDRVSIELEVQDAAGQQSHRFVQIGFAMPLSVEPSSTPAMAVLEQNRPNPFLPSTEISFVISDGASTSVPVRLVVYDVAGREVRTLVDELASPGRHTLSWDARNDAGHRVEEGVYFYRLRAGDTDLVRKMVMAR